MIKKILNIVVFMVLLVLPSFAQEEVYVKPQYERLEYIKESIYSDRKAEYYGWALIGTAYTAARWKIMRITTNSNDDYVVEFADGNSNYDNVMSNYLNLTYE